MDRLLALLVVLLICKGSVVEASCSDNIIHSCETALTRWQLERISLYLNLEQMTDDLHSFHEKSSAVKVVGSSVVLLGTASLILGFVPGGQLLCFPAYAKAAQLAGGVTVGGTSIFQLYQDWTTIEEVKRLLKSHEAAHENLMRCLSLFKIPMNNRDHHQSDLTDLQKNLTREGVNITIDTLKYIVKIYAGVPEKMYNVKSILREIDYVIESLAVMSGLKVPDTVRHLRWLKHDLKQEQDDLIMQLENLFLRLGL